jgi:hypothetical protein
MRLSGLISAILLSAAALLGAQTASAATYTNSASWNGSDNTFGFGSPDTTSYGEIFTAPSDGPLQSMGFLINANGQSGNAKLVVAQWNGTQAIGPAIYTSAEFALDSSSGYQWNTVSGINAVLTTGSQYIAYFTTAGVSNPVGSGTFWASTDDHGGVGGDLAFANTNGVDPLSSLPTWTVTWANSDFVYQAQFGTAVTPIPAALPLFASGLVALGVVGHRRRKATAA